MEKGLLDYGCSSPAAKLVFALVACANLVHGGQRQFPRVGVGVDEMRWVLWETRPDRWATGFLSMASKVFHQNLLK